MNQEQLDNAKMLSHQRLIVRFLTCKDDDVAAVIIKKMCKSVLELEGNAYVYESFLRLFSDILYAGDQCSPWMGVVNSELCKTFEEGNDGH